jgi:hypothetical protein
MGATTSGFVEAQALFTTTPITLVATGEYIQLLATFTTTAGILAGPGTGSYVSFGLFNSGGTAPVPGGALANAGITSTAGSPYGTGYAANWAGYMGRIRETTGSSRFNSRPIQSGSGSASANQDLIFGGETAGYANPAGVQIGSTATFGATLIPNTQYTYTLTLTFDASTGFITAAENLYSGVGTGGASLFSLTGTTAAGSTPTLQFDGFALGYRFAESVDAASTLDVSGIEITSNVSVVPEPGSASLLLLGAGAGLLLIRRRHA